MERPKERNEFGLDRFNKMDVRSERGDSTITWVIGALTIFAVFGMLAFFTSNTGTQVASNPPTATTGQGNTTPAPVNR